MSDTESVNQTELCLKNQPDLIVKKYGYIPVCETHQSPSEIMY